MSGKSIEFAHSPARHWLGIQPTWRSTILALIVLALCAIGGGWVAWSSADLISRAAQEREQIEWLHTRVTGLKGREDRPTTAFTRDEVVELNRIARQLNTPWATIFAVLERHTASTVALIAIEPDSNRGSVRVTAEGRSLQHLMAYAAHLREDRAVARVTPLEHDTAVQEPGAPLRMVLEFSFEPSQ